jgi:hypothetical protein
MVRVDTEGVAESERRISRKKLLRRAAVGGGVLYAAPFMTSAALGGPAEGAPRCNTRVVDGTQIRACDQAEPCVGQTVCSGDLGSNFCTCVPLCPGDDRVGGCFCHQPQACAGLTACTSSGDCPPTWKCTTSCCSSGPGDCFCLPPCGTNAAFASVAAAVAANVRTSVG